jgi:hypothetical protein
MLIKLGKNIGYAAGVVSSHSSQEDFAEKQKLAWEKCRQAIDEGLPCYGWDLDIPEYYVIYGYDDIGYHFSGPLSDAGGGPKPWLELGLGDIGVLFMACLRPVEASDDKKTVKEALKFALEHAKNPEKWIYQQYKSGLEGYENWINALEKGEVHAMGMAYNAAVWNECRQYAVLFLKEAKDRVGGNLGEIFDEAISCYEKVAYSLKTVACAFPFIGQRPEHIEDESRRAEAVEALKSARDNEEAGLNSLEGIVAKI